MSMFGAIALLVSADGLQARYFYALESCVALIAHSLESVWCSQLWNTRSRSFYSGKRTSIAALGVSQLLSSHEVCDGMREASQPYLRL